MKLLDRKQPPPLSEDFRYHAFISYNQELDGTLALALHAGLRKFAKPWYRVSGMRVFRDRTDLAATPQLWGSIEDSLRRTRFLVLLASRAAAKSKWVPREISYWLEQRGSNHLLIVLTDGEIVWDDEGKDFDWNKTSALPQTLAHAFAEEPAYVDLRGLRNAKRLSLRNPEFASVVARLTAQIHGRPLAELIGEDAKQRRLQKALGAFFTVAMIILAGIWIEQARRAGLDRIDTQARRLASASQQQFAQHPDIGLLLGVEAMRLAPRPDVIAGLLRLLRLRPEVVTYLRGHKKDLTAVAISIDGKIAASADKGGNVQIWDLGTAQLRTTLVVPDVVRSVAISPDGMTVAVGGHKAVTLWSTVAGSRIREIGRAGRGAVNALAFDATGSRLASAGSDGRLILSDVNRVDHDEPAFEVGLGSITRLAFSPDGQSILLGGAKGACIWDVRTSSVRALASTVDGNAVTAVAFSPDGLRFVIGTLGAIEVHDAATGARIGQAAIAQSAWANGVAYIAGTELANVPTILSAASDGPLTLWDASTLTQRRPPLMGSLGVVRMAVSLGSDRVVTANADQSLTLWHLNRRDIAEMQLPVRHRNGVASIAASPDGRFLASAGYDGRVNVFTSDGRPLFAVVEDDQATVQSLAFSADGSRIASTGGKGYLKVRDAKTGVVLSKPMAGSSVLSNIVFAPTGKGLLVAAEDRIIIWDIERNTEVASTAAPGGKPALNVAYSPNGELVAVSGGDGVVHVLLASSLKPIEKWAVTDAGQVVQLAFNPDGREMAAAAVDGSIVAWSLRQRKTLWKISMAHVGEPLTIAYSADGNLLASGGGDGAIALWDARTGESVDSMAAHEGMVGAVVFGLGEGILASAGIDGTIKLWSIGLRGWTKRACAIAGRDLTDAEWLQYLGEPTAPGTCRRLREAAE